MKIAALIATAVLFSAPAQAATMTYYFSAEYAFGLANDDTVSTIADTAEALIGTTLTGTITFDDTFVSGDAVRRVYAAPTITIDQMDLSGVLPFTEILLQNGEFGFDGYTLRSDLTGSSGDVVSSIFMTLRDTDETIIGDTGFPPLPALSEFEVTEIGFIGNVIGESNARERVNYTLTSLSTTPVPLPAGGLLLLSGLAGLAWKRPKSA
ncbi:VPLPA-CTERM sorting domain-containing protein [Tropicimonas sp. IMCC6043]|uniref:VPLPA-CTERM sorting domain-containing protein n=1 Tax=Tropicimonas sp. IMCC6043 TaxID=2510645 RepID=UPI00101D3247|nr:VPLPA-CTERM sorting domain-containing protein [Tropicimonas sp. IMCC6043]RYH06851.1 VPLPA-CTERM sorting domain-containing protein [Tropicimonas sp. IMCC6043]